MFVGLLLLGCPDSTLEAPAGELASVRPEERDADGEGMRILEPQDGFVQDEGTPLSTRVSVSGAVPGLRWTVNGETVPGCPSAADSLACDVSALAAGDGGCELAQVGAAGRRGASSSVRGSREGLWPVWRGIGLKLARSSAEGDSLLFTRRLISTAKMLR